MQEWDFGVWITMQNKTRRAGESEEEYIQIVFILM